MRNLIMAVKKRILIFRFDLQKIGEAFTGRRARTVEDAGPYNRKGTAWK